MKFSTGLPGLHRYPPAHRPWMDDMTPADFKRVARAADELGFDAIVVPEHIVLPTALVPAMGARWPHAWTVMAFLAGVTDRIGVNSSVTVLPYHHPVVLAKAVATLDQLSGGRVILSFGIGHAEGEFAALGVPFHQRGQMADEYLEAMKVLWTEPEPEFHGRFLDFRDISFDPKPVQQPHPPIWIGGNSSAALRRAARHGQGWVPWLVTADELPARLEELRDEPGFDAKQASFGIDLPVAPMQVNEVSHLPLPGSDGHPAGPAGAQQLIDAIGHLEEIGVTWTSVPPPGPPPGSLSEHLDQLAWVAEEVLPPFSAARGGARSG